MANQSKHFPFSVDYNFHQSDLVHKGIFSHHNPEVGGPFPPVSGNFFLSDNTPFLLSDGSNFLLS